MTTRYKIWLVAGASLLCLLGVGQVLGADRTVARMGELRASVSAQNWCGPVVQVQVDAPPETQLSASSRKLQLLIGGVRQILTLECPGLKELQMTANSGGQVAGHWRLVGEGQLELVESLSTSDKLISVTGNQEIADRFLLWTIGNHPQLAAELYIQQRLNLYDFPPGLPEVAPGYNRDTSQAQARLEAAGMLFADSPPTEVVIEVPMTIKDDYRDPQGPPTISSSGVERIGNSPAITKIIVGDMQIALEKPFFLHLPDGFVPVQGSMLAPTKGKTIARVIATLSDFSPDLRGGYYRGGRAKAELNSVSFLYRSVIRDKGPTRDGPDEVLHVWQSGEVEEFQVSRPVDAFDITKIFGGGASEGRYVLNGNILPTSTDNVPRPLLQAGSFVFAMQLAALTEAQPERPMDRELAEFVMRSLLSERERTDLFPLSIAKPGPNDKPTEFALRKALSTNDATMRQRVRDRVPELPLSIRFVGTGALGEYDFESNGFPVSLRSNSGRWLPTDGGGRGIIERLPDFLPVGSADAETLLDRLSRDSTGRHRLTKLVIDYDLDKLLVRAGRTGPISKEEVASVRPVFSSIIAAGLYSATDLAQPLHIIPVPDGFEAIASERAGDSSAKTESAALPDGVYLTTGKSLMGAIERLDESGEIIGKAIRSVRSLPATPSNTYEARRATFRDELREKSRDSYWIGADFKLEPYDADLGGFPMTQVSFRPVAHSEDFDGVAAPKLRAAADEDYTVLRVPPKMAEAVGDVSGNNRSVGAYLRVKPVDTIYDRSKGAILLVSAPLEAIFEKTTGYSIPSKADVRVSLGAPDRIGIAVTVGENAANVEVPEALLLDPEGLDLLALSLAPEAFDDAMFQRMLVDRLLKERNVKAKAEKSGEVTAQPLSWRRFFANPDQPLRASTIDTLLPEFRTWTLARAAALPNTLLLPSGNFNPISECRGLRVLRQPDVDMNTPFLEANLTKILGPEVALTQGLGSVYASGRSKAGPDVVWRWEGGGHTGTGLDCRYVSSGLHSLDSGIRPDKAPYISTLVVVREQPSLGGVTKMPDSFLYTLSIDDVRFVPSASLSKPPEGLAGFVVVTSQVEAAEGFQQDRSDGGYKSVGRIEHGDWGAVVATQPKSLDIIGLTLEMPLAEFEAAMRDRMSTAATYVTAVPGKSMFGYAMAFVDIESGEAVTAIYADHVDGKPVIALKRRMQLDASETSVDSLKLALEEKYGADYRDDHGTYFYWGALPVDEDTLGYCGGYSVFQVEDQDAMPYFELANDEASGARQSYQVRSLLSEFGWPSDFKRQTLYTVPDITQCTTMVAVAMFQSGPELTFSTWLFDRELVERMDSVPRLAPSKAKTDL